MSEIFETSRFPDLDSEKADIYEWTTRVIDEVSKKTGLSFEKDDLADEREISPYRYRYESCRRCTAAAPDNSWSIRGSIVEAERIGITPDPTETCLVRRISAVRWPQNGGVEYLCVEQSLDPKVKAASVVFSQHHPDSTGLSQGPKEEFLVTQGGLYGKSFLADWRRSDRGSWANQIAKGEHILLVTEFDVTKTGKKSLKTINGMLPQALAMLPGKKEVSDNLLTDCTDQDRWSNILTWL